MTVDEREARDAKIYELLQDDLLYKDIAKAVGCCSATVSSVIKANGWRDIGTRRGGPYGRSPWNKGLSVAVRPRRLLMDHSCLRCGTRFQAYPSERRKFCSFSCRSRANARSGADNRNWQGGITPTYLTIRHSAFYREWRRAVLVRDGYRCLFCGANQQLQVDHIKPFAVIVRAHAVKSLDDAIACEELWDMSNARTLCLPCHKATPTYLRPVHCVG